MISEKALTSIVSFAILGIYLGFQMVVLAALRARLKGWEPSGVVHPRSLGAAGDHRGPDVRRPDDDQHRLAAHPRRALVRQLPGRALGDRRRRHRRGLHGSREALPAQRRPLTATPCPPQKESRNEVQLRHAAGLSAQRVPGLDQEGRRARVLRRVRRRRDLAQGPLAPVRRGRGADHQHPDGAEHLRRRAPRADPDRPGRGHPGRADQRARRGRHLQRQLRPARAVPHRLGQDEASLPGQGGRRR